MILETETVTLGAEQRRRLSVALRGNQNSLLYKKEYAALDALLIGETWEFAFKKFPKTTTPATLAHLYHLRTGRILRTHTTARGYMFVRIE